MPTDDESERGTPILARRCAAEGLGTAFLLAAVVGSGIMGERLAGGNVALALLANTLATGAALVALILTFGSISGAHLNPASHPSGCLPEVPSLERGPGLPCSSTPGRLCWSGGCQFDVSGTLLFCLSPWARWRGSDFQ